MKFEQVISKPEMNSDDEQAERELETLLAILPRELQDHWETAIEGLETSEALQAIREVVTKRGEKTHPKVRLAAELGQNPNKEWALEVSMEEIDRIHSSAEMEENFLGKGNVAKVYRSAASPSICYKIVHDLDAYREGNSIYEEGAFLEDLDSVEVDGARAPHFYYYAESSNLLALSMETIEGFTVEEILRDPGLVLQLKERRFDPDSFIKKVSDFVKKMHQLKIYHGDLFSRNIMVDMKTLEPRIIDFGKAKRIYFSEEVGLRELSDFECMKLSARNLKKAFAGQAIDFSENI